jgi:hypothetical protein
MSASIYKALVISSDSPRSGSSLVADHKDVKPNAYCKACSTKIAFRRLRFLLCRIYPTDKKGSTGFPACFPDLSKILECR